MPAGWMMLVFLAGALFGAFVRHRRAQKKVADWYAAANRR